MMCLSKPEKKIVIRMFEISSNLRLSNIKLLYTIIQYHYNNLWNNSSITLICWLCKNSETFQENQFIQKILILIKYLRISYDWLILIIIFRGESTKSNKRRNRVSKLKKGDCSSTSLIRKWWLILEL